MPNDIAAILASHQLRVTKPRREVFRILKEASQPLSHTEIAKLAPTIDRVSVYRTIDAFTARGIVTAVTIGWKQRYELAAPFKPHHHHLACVTCGRLEEIHSQKLEKIIHYLADSQRFKVTGHVFEVTGMCRSCQRQKTSHISYNKT